MESISGRHHDVLESTQNLTCCLVNQGQQFGYLCKILDNFCVVFYQSKEGTNMFRSCWWVHLLNSLCFLKVEGGKIHPKYWISLEKKWHLLNFMESFANWSFSNTLLMCNRCSSAVLLKIIMSSKYAIAKSKSFKIPVINSWKYAGAWAHPKGTLMYSYLPKEGLNAALSIKDLSKGIWW